MTATLHPDNTAPTDDEPQIKVLLIEDDDAIAAMYAARLAHEGYNVITARDGVSGLALAGREQPDLVYLDLRLPGMDGFEVLEHLRADRCTAAIPVVILTNYDEDQLRARGLRLGVLEFLVKSDVTPARLADTTPRWASPAATPTSR